MGHYKYVTLSMRGQTLGFIYEVDFRGKEVNNHNPENTRSCPKCTEWYRNKKPLSGKMQISENICCIAASCFEFLFIIVLC